MKIIKQKFRLENVQTMGHMFLSSIKMYEGEQNNLKPMWLLKYSCCSTFSPLPCETRGHRQVAEVCIYKQHKHEKSQEIIS